MAPVILLFLYGCTRERVTGPVKNLNGNIIIMLGHGGMGNRSLLPMNSEASIEKVIGKGADGSEADVQLSADSVPVLYHNVFLSDNTGCSGEVNDQNAAYLSGCRYKDVRPGSSSIITLDELQSRSYFGSAYWSFDCKISERVSNDTLFLRRFARAMNRQIEKVPSDKLIFVEAPNPYFLSLISKKNGRVKTLLNTDVWREDLSAIQHFSVDGIIAHYTAISLSDSEEIHAMGLWLALWGPENGTQNKTCISLMPDVIQTDDIESLLKLR